MKHSTQLFAFLFMAFPFLFSCALSNKKPIFGNHQLVNQRIDIENYEKVVLKIPGEVFYQQFSDSAPYLQIHTDENILNALDVKVENNQLIISVKDDSIIKPSQLTIYTSSHNLNQVMLVGSCEIRLKGEVNAENFNLSIFGSGNLRADSLLCNKMEVNITGSGNTQLTGASNYSSYMITGSGSIQALNYLVQDLNCTITGSGNIDAFVSQKLNAHLTGSGNLSYRGDPQSVDKRITGSGKITSKVDIASPQ
jgi:hypothetical protein